MEPSRQQITFEDAWRNLWKDGKPTPHHYRNYVHKLSDQGHYVVGVELVEQPVKKFFETQHLDFKVEISSNGPIYKTTDERITVYVSNLFSLSRYDLGTFDMIWDRASFVALNKRDRERYVCLLKSLMGEGCRYLLSAVDMKKTSGEPTKGPPHVTNADDIQNLFGNQYEVCFLEGLDCTTDAVPAWGVEWFYENLYLIKALNAD